MPHSLTAQQTCTEHLRWASLELHPRSGGPHPRLSRHTASEGRQQSLQGDRTAGARRQPGKSPGQAQGTGSQKSARPQESWAGGPGRALCSPPNLSGFSSMHRAQ